MKKLDGGGNGESDLDVIIDRVAPDLKAQFLQDRLRIQQFVEHDEVLAVSRYLGTTVILIDRLTKNLAGIPFAPRTTGPDLKQIEDAITRAMQKRRDDVAVLSALDEMPRHVGDYVAKLVQEDLEALRIELTPEKQGERNGRSAWIQKILAFVSRRSVIAIACFVLGALPFLLLYVHSERQRADDANSRIVAMMNRLPDSVRLNMSGNITYSPAAAGKPAKVVLNFGQKLRPVTAEVTRANEVEVVFAP